MVLKSKDLATLHNWTKERTDNFLFSPFISHLVYLNNFRLACIQISFMGKILLPFLAFQDIKSLCWISGKLIISAYDQIACVREEYNICIEKSEWKNNFVENFLVQIWVIVKKKREISKSSNLSNSWKIKYIRFSLRVYIILNK